MKPPSHIFRIAAACLFLCGALSPARALAPALGARAGLPLDAGRESPEVRALLEEVSGPVSVYGQWQLFDHWSRLDEAGKLTLLEDIRRIPFEFMFGRKTPSGFEGGLMHTVIDEEGRPVVSSPPEEFRLPPVIGNERPAAREIGRRALAWGAESGRARFATIVVAGGMGSGLGYKYPKGMFPACALSHKPLYQILIEKSLAAARAHGHEKMYPMIIMVSDDTRAETLRFLEENDYFGQRDRVLVVNQRMLPLIESGTGKILMRDPSHVFWGGAGHGDAFDYVLGDETLTDQDGRNVARRLDELGVEFVQYSNVDNILCPFGDEAFLGEHIASGAAAEEAGALEWADEEPEESFRDRVRREVVRRESRGDRESLIVRVGAERTGRAREILEKENYFGHPDRVLLAEIPFYEPGAAHISLMLIPKANPRVNHAFDRLGNVVRVPRRVGGKSGWADESVEYEDASAVIKARCGLGDPSIRLVSRRTLKGSAPIRFIAAHNKAAKVLASDGGVREARVVKFERSSGYKMRYGALLGRPQEEVFASIKNPSRTQRFETPASAARLASDYWKRMLRRAGEIVGRPFVLPDSTLVELPWIAAWMDAPALVEALEKAGFPHELQEGRGYWVDGPLAGLDDGRWVAAPAGSTAVRILFPEQYSYKMSDYWKGVLTEAGKAGGTPFEISEECRVELPEEAAWTAPAELFGRLSAAGFPEKLRAGAFYRLEGGLESGHCVETDLAWPDGAAPLGTAA